MHTGLPCPSPLAWALPLALLALGPITSAGAPKSAEIEWLKSKAIPLKTCEAGSGFEDLAGLKRLVGDARIVSLGECTHGTREVFQMKHRLLEYLASECGFTLFSIEANMPEAYRLNDYVLEGKGDPAKLIAGMYFWTWRTEEVLAMVEWMRKFNESGKGRVEFTGFDMQTPDVAMENVVRFVRLNDPAQQESIAETYRQVKESRPGNRESGNDSGFGVATGSFPIEAVKGRKVRYSGWIKTAGVTRGFAGLWWRADGPNGPLAFDNMQSREIKGDTGWKEHDLVLDIPTNTININFGLLLPGNGTAWFDDLKVEIDGQPFDPADRFDFGFESGTLKGFFTAGKGFVSSVDKGVARTGERSLRMKFVGAPEPAKTRAELTPAAAARACENILKELEAGRERYLSTSPSRDVEWALQNARVVLQCAQMDAGEVARDPSMAANVKWILDQAPKGSRIVLWAHNGHVARQQAFGSKAMGFCLEEWYGKDQVVIGFAAGEGRYTAILQNKGLRSDNALQSPAKGSFEEYARASGIPQFLLDLRLASSDDRGSGWLTGSRPFRSIGALAMEQQFGPATLPALFDAVIYFDRTTPSRILP